MLGSFGAPLIEKFFVRRLSANLITFTRSARAPGIVAETFLISPISAENPCARAGAAEATIRSARATADAFMFAPLRSVDRKTIEHARAAGRDQIRLTAPLRPMRRVPRGVAAADAVRMAELRRALT